jgi:hypothetical protein
MSAMTKPTETPPQPTIYTCRFHLTVRLANTTVRGTCATEIPFVPKPGDGFYFRTRFFNLTDNPTASIADSVIWDAHEGCFLVELENEVRPEMDFRTTDLWADYLYPEWRWASEDGTIFFRNVDP